MHGAMSHSKKPPAGPPLGSSQASLAAQLGNSVAVSSFTSIAVGASQQHSAAKKSSVRRQIPLHTAAAADHHASNGLGATSTGSTSLSGNTSINIVSPQSPSTMLPPPSPTASIRQSSLTPSSFLYDSTSDAGNFFSEQDLLASDHAYIYSHQTHGAPLPLPSYFNSATAASSTPGSPMRSLSSASANAFQASSSLFDDLGSSRGDFKTPLECKVFNLRERMRDDFLDLLRQFNAEQRNKNRFGATTHNQTNMQSHHHTSHRPSISSPAHEHAFAFNNGGNSNNSNSSSKSIESAMIKFIHEAHPVNFMWFAIELFVSELVSRCWSGVELLENRENSATASGAVTASSHAQMMKLELRLKQPATTTVLASGERKQSGAGLNSAAPSPSPRNQNPSALHTPRKPHNNSNNTPTSLRNQQQSSYPQQQNYRSALSPSYGNASTTHGFGFNQDNGHVNPASHFPPHLSFSFLHSASSASTPSTAIHAAMQSLFPDIQEFFAAFVLCAGEHSYKLCVHLRQAIIMKMHQLTDIGAHVTKNVNNPSVNVSSASASAPHLSSQQWRFTQSNSVELARTWHGRILKLKLLSKFLSLLSVLPNFDLTRMAAVGGAPLGVGVDGLMQYTPSAAMTNVMHNTCAAINTLSFPSQAPSINAPTNLMSQAWIALAPTAALASFSVDTFPLHLYLSYARVTESLSLFLPFICTYMRVLKFDLVNLQSDFYQRLLQEMADIYFQLKKFIEQQRQAQSKLLNNSKPTPNANHHNQHGVGIQRTFSSPVIFSSSTSSSPSFAPISTTISNASIATTVTTATSISGSDIHTSPAFTPILTPNVSPFPSPLPATAATNSTVASAYATGGNLAAAVHSPDAPSGKKSLNASYDSPTFETDVTPPLSPQLSAVSTQIDDRKPDEGRSISPFVFPPAASTASPSISKQSQSGVDDSLHSTLSSPRMVNSSGRNLTVSSPSPVHMYNGLSSASAAASVYSTRSQAFLAFELEELFEWLELDLHAYAEDFTRRKRREGWKSIHRDVVSAVNSNLNTPPQVLHSSRPQTMHTPTTTSQAQDRDHSSPAAFATNNASVSSPPTSSVTDPPPPRARKSLMSDFTHSTQSTVLHVRPLRAQAPPPSTGSTRISALPPAQPVTAQTHVTSTPPSTIAPTGSAADVGIPAVVVRPTLTLDTIPHLVADNLFLSLLTSSQSRKSLDEVRHVMNGDYNSSSASGPTSVRKDSISGETELDSSGSINMPLLRRSASVATKRKIAPTTEATPSLTSPVSSSNSSSSQAASASSLALLRRDFFKRHQELSPLVRFVADNLEKHVLKDGHCINTIVAERFAEAMEVFNRDSQVKVSLLESNKNVTALKGLVETLPASERTLLSSVTPNILQRVYDAVSVYLDQSMLQALRSLASPTLHAVVIESAAQLTSQHSFTTIKAAVTERVKQGVKSHSEKAFKKLKQSWLAKCNVWIGDNASESQVTTSMVSDVKQPVDLAPTVGNSSDENAVNYVRLELVTRVNNALRCFQTLDIEQQQQLSEATLCKQGKRLLQVLLPLSICVSASQASTQAARQASFACFGRTPVDSASTPGFFDKACLALLPLARHLSTNPLARKLLGHVYDQCWQRIEAVYRVVARMSSSKSLLLTIQSSSTFPEFPSEFVSRMERLTTFAPSDSSAVQSTTVLSSE